MNSLKISHDFLLQGDGSGEYSQWHCEFRDIMMARQDHMTRDLMQTVGVESSHLLGAISGEIGNNSFDHNLGKWDKIRGCWFSYEIFSDHVLIIIGDKGQGITQSLRSAHPVIQSNEEAMEIAFAKILSGRFPEKRGNGLKFVAKIINHTKPRGLVCLSGDSVFATGQKKEVLMNFVRSCYKESSINGTVTFIWWGIAP